MGRDIHSWLERRQGDTWTYASPPEDAEDAEDGWPDVYDERSYSTFAVLAGVRNRANLAPIAAPRGLPHDLSPEGRRRADADDEGHNHSWLTLRELVEFDWTRLYVVETRAPITEVRARIASGALDGATAYVVPDEPNARIAGFESYAAACDYFLNTTLPAMHAVGGLDDVRLVFYFDN